MSRRAPLTAALLLLAVTIAPCPGQNRPELQPDAILSTVRELIPAMGRTLDLRVYEPIPVRVVTRRQLEDAIAGEIESQLRTVGQEDGALDPTGGRTGAGAGAAGGVARQVAAKLAPRYLVRWVLERESGALLVAPENLDALLVADRSPLRQIRSLLRFELTRELTRLADAETRALQDPPAPPAASTHALAAHLAFLEGRAVWAASRLVPGVNRPVAPIEVAEADLRDESKLDSLLLYALAGTGCERGGIWAAQMAGNAGQAALKALVLDPPATFRTFPAAGADARDRADRPGPLDGVVRMTPMLCAGEAWQLTVKQPAHEEIARRLEPGDPSGRTRSLLSGLREIREATASQPSGGQVHVSAAVLQNPSAAYAWMRAEERRFAERARAMAAEGYDIEGPRSRSHDLDGYPVLLMTETTAQSDEATVRIVRFLAVRDAYYLEVSAVNADLDWDRVRAFLEKARPQLTPSDRFPG